MIPELLLLAREVAGEKGRLGLVVKKTTRAVERAREAPSDQDFFMESAALNIHTFYAGCERIFETIARRVERSVPSGVQWHADLLRQMSADIRPARPEVISETTRDRLEEFRGFRHLVRNIYTYELNHELIARLAAAVPSVYEALSRDLDRFVSFLESVARQEP